MFAHLFAGKRFNSAVQILGEIGEKIAALSGRWVPLARARLGLLAEGLACLGGSGMRLEQLAHLLANAETGPVKPNPNRSLLKVEESAQPARWSSSSISWSTRTIRNVAGMRRIA